MQGGSVECEVNIPGRVGKVFDLSRDSRKSCRRIRGQQDARTSWSVWQRCSGEACL